ncbi:MAG: hypothetical protein U9R53_12480 [Chloroflexota bacterium]|nr:hypothetical protein [Chloroflexota bacterium]
MHTSTVYIIISIAAIAIVALLLFFVLGKNKKSKLTPLAGLAFVCVTAGIVFGDNRLIGYGLMGVGVVLAVIDMVIKMKQK